MDVLKIFNLVVCQNKTSTSSTWMFNILFAPMGILFSFTSYSILAYLTILLFAMLIYTSDSSILKYFNKYDDGKGNFWASLFTGFILYFIQTLLILLFLRYSVCQQTLEWDNRDIHLNVQHYNNQLIDTSDLLY